VGVHSLHCGAQLPLLHRPLLPSSLSEKVTAKTKPMTTAAATNDEPTKHKEPNQRSERDQRSLGFGTPTHIFPSDPVSLVSCVSLLLKTPGVASGLFTVRIQQLLEALATEITEKSGSLEEGSRTGFSEKQ